MPAFGRLGGWKLPTMVAAAIVCCATAVGLVLWASGEDRVEGSTPKDRVAAIGRLSSGNSPGASEALVRALDDPAPEVRRAAVAGMVRYIRPENRAAVEKAASDADGRVRAAAVSVLGLYRDAPAADKLADVAVDDPEEQVRIAALRGLAACPGPLSVVTLVEIAEKGQSFNLKYQALVAAFEKCGARLQSRQRPDDPAVWEELVYQLKRLNRVQKAYAALGRPLNVRPEDGMSPEHRAAFASPGAPPERPKE